MEREVINLTEFEVAPILYEYALENEEYWDKETGILIFGIWEDFEEIQMEVTDIDLDKGYEDREVVVRRKSDGKFFKGNYSYSNYWIEYSTILKEVFPKEVTITIYE